MVIVPLLLMIALQGICQHKANATASAVIVNPIGINMELVSSSPDNDYVLYNGSLNSQWKVQQVSIKNDRVSAFTQVIQIANLQLMGSNATLFDLMLPGVLTLRNNTSESFLRLKCFAQQNHFKEKIEIKAAISIPANQILGNYVAEEDITLMVNFN